MKHRKISFRTKIYVSFSLLNMFFLSICSFAFYYYTSASLKENMHDNIISSTSLLLDDLDSMLKSADNSLKELQINPELHSASKNITHGSSNFFPRNVPVSTLFQNAFRSTLDSYEINGSINYVSSYNDYIGVSTEKGVHHYLSKNIIEDNKEIKVLIDEIKYCDYIPPHKDYWGYDQIVFSVVRAMRDPYSKYGIFVLDFNISALTCLLENFENPSDYSITILDANENPVYSSNPDLDISALYDCYKETALKSGTNIFSYEEQSLSCYKISEYTGWTFILTGTTTNYLSSVRRMIVISIILFFTLFGLISIFLYFITYRLTKPLKQLTHQLEILEPGSNIHIEKYNSPDEITTLTNAIQGFLAEIYKQNQQLTEERKRTLLAHYDAMEAQLNPHFLYNTLSVIGMTALNSGNQDVSIMCSELASLLRYSLSYTGQAVQFSQEIDNASSYLYIMKIRYEDDLTCEWNLDESLNDIRVPKLILQPLIENCFQHGFRQNGIPLPPPWKIKISSVRKDSYWYLTIIDSGISFPKEKELHLQERLNRFKTSLSRNPETNDLSYRTGFGLENTLLRLAIYYNNKEFFEISQPDEGWTAITIGGPIDPQK